MPDNYYRKFIKKLKAYDCTFVRYGKGDHEIWYSPINQTHITIPSKCPSRHTANKALKDAGIKEKI